MPRKKDEPEKPRKVVYSTWIDADVVEALRSLAAADRRSMAAQLSWIVMEEQARRKDERRAARAARAARAGGSDQGEG